MAQNRNLVMCILSPIVNGFEVTAFVFLWQFCNRNHFMGWFYAKLRIMIDWFEFVFNLLWVIACALALAVLSYSSFLASQNHQSLRSVLQSKTSQAWLMTAGLLFCAGQVGTSSSLLYRIAWLVLAAIFIVQMFIVLRSSP